MNYESTIKKIIDMKVLARNNIKEYEKYMSKEEKQVANHIYQSIRSTSNNFISMYCGKEGEINEYAPLYLYEAIVNLCKLLNEMLYKIRSIKQVEVELCIHF